ncbi:uncharacterized protein PAC_05071 [Phialocephala subalpina]|uniref:Uncharacterized protein n=1 Tax=Phialocephala subalpina TaxID=576137 RepID=A0A1L7WR09_9HELO|nr:uncharacterized protein PAC_05071 [Phialocephala subalpina]
MFVLHIRLNPHPKPLTQYCTLPTTTNHAHRSSQGPAPSNVYRSLPAARILRMLPTARRTWLRTLEENRFSGTGGAVCLMDGAVWVVVFRSSDAGSTIAFSFAFEGAVVSGCEFAFGHDDAVEVLWVVEKCQGLEFGWDIREDDEDLSSLGIRRWTYFLMVLTLEIEVEQNV